MTDLSSNRRETIATRLASGQTIIAGVLATEFGVSEDAIRRDLRALAAEGKCRRVYGGALPISPNAVPLVARIDEGQPAKRTLARAGASSVRPGELIFVDSGSTNLWLVEMLPEYAELTVVTNSPDIAAAALRRGDLSVIVVGGMADPVIGGCVDAMAVQAIAEMRFDRAFIGACAVSTDGISAFHHADSIFKRLVVRQAAQTVVLATTDKLDGRAPHHVAAPEQVGLLVIEENATPTQRSALDDGGYPRRLIAGAQ